LAGVAAVHATKAAGRITQAVTVALASECACGRCQAAGSNVGNPVAVVAAVAKVPISLAHAKAFVTPKTMTAARQPRATAGVAPGPMTATGTAIAGAGQSVATARATALAIATAADHAVQAAQVSTDLTAQAAASTADLANDPVDSTGRLMQAGRVILGVFTVGNRRRVVHTTRPIILRQRGTAVDRVSIPPMVQATGVRLGRCTQTNYKRAHEGQCQPDPSPFHETHGHSLMTFRVPLLECPDSGERCSASRHPSAAVPPYLRPPQILLEEPGSTAGKQRFSLVNEQSIRRRPKFALFASDLDRSKLYTIQDAGRKQAVWRALRNSELGDFQATFECLYP